MGSLDYLKGTICKIVELCPTSAHYSEETSRRMYEGTVVEITHASVSDEITRCGYPEFLSITFKHLSGIMKGRHGCIYGAKVEQLHVDPTWEV